MKSKGVLEAIDDPETRNAVAELIEAGERSLNWLSSYQGGCAENTYRQMRAALTRCKGE